MRYFSVKQIDLSSERKSVSIAKKTKNTQHPQRFSYNDNTFRLSCSQTTLDFTVELKRRLWLCCKDTNGALGKWLHVSQSANIKVANQWLQNPGYIKRKEACGGIDQRFLTKSYDSWAQCGETHLSLLWWICRHPSGSFTLSTTTGSRASLSIITNFFFFRNVQSHTLFFLILSLSRPGYLAAASRRTWKYNKPLWEKLLKLQMRRR